MSQLKAKLKRPVFQTENLQNKRMESYINLFTVKTFFQLLFIQKRYRNKYAA